MLLREQARSQSSLGARPGLPGVDWPLPPWGSMSVSQKLGSLAAQNQRLLHEKRRAEERASQLCAEAVLLEAKLASLEEKKKEAEEIASQLCAAHLQAQFDREQSMPARVVGAVRPVVAAATSAVGRAF